MTPPAVRGLVQELLTRLVEVEARLKQTSRNSSKPPSSDPPSAQPRPAKASSGRKPGGQPGHEGQGRKLQPEAEVDHLIEVRPESCGHCGTLLLGRTPSPSGSK
jgi:transposase